MHAQANSPARDCNGLPTVWDPLTCAFTHSRNIYQHKPGAWSGFEVRKRSITCERSPWSQVSQGAEVILKKPGVRVTLLAHSERAGGVRD